MYRQNETYIDGFDFKKLKKDSGNEETVRRQTLKNEEYNGLIKTMPDNMSCMIYIWTAGSFIPFHNDEFKDRKLAMTLFLNRDWEKNWGGANIHHNKELDKYILEYPEFNKLLVSDLSENIEHSTTMTTPMSDNRITIQMFI